jgi:hypothetical protein
VSLTSDEVELIQERTYEIGLLLHGIGPVIQGAILADLLAIWLAGHFGSNGMREQLLNDHIRTVWQLIPCNEREILARHRRTAN